MKLKKKTANGKFIPKSKDIEWTNFLLDVRHGI